MKKFVFLCLILISNLVSAVDPQLNVNFKPTNEKIENESLDKIEVVEMFWYGCIHCFQFEPAINKWKANLPKDVVFKRVPAVPRRDWIPMARTYYAMESLGIVDDFHGKLFDAIHKDKTLNPGDESAAIQWIATNAKLDTDKVKSAFKSFSMEAKLKKANQMFRSAGATGVPTLIINGSYLTSSTMAGGPQNAIEITEFIIENIRKDLKKK
ncbi:MAG: thiol:disulfide interchange protein DsbA/DsbL [Methylophilaceae bacterium]|jgi:thiol:disulfide interchange protein DsbA